MDEGRIRQVGVGAESPGAVRLSLAAAMTLGFKPGLFYRNARLRCINLLETYGAGCAARCAYCGLARDGSGQSRGRSFIRVGWPTLELDSVVAALVERRAAFDRVCVSMVSRRRAQDDLVEIVRRVRARVDAPISALLSPTFVDRAGLVAIREAGVDRVGVAVDAATPELFDELRGAGVFGPHGWQRYWEGIGEAVEVFGDGMAGCHLIVGLGETERQMVEALGRVRSLGAVTHLFSFYPEPGSALEQEQQPPVGQYRRMQLARYLVDTGLGSAEAMEFESSGRLLGFGVDDATLSRVVACGEPFETSGCPGADGRVACNRPFANTRPGPEIRNFPFPLEEADLLRVREELWS